MNIEAFLSAKLAQPITHRVTTVYEGGAVRSHDVRSLAAAENWAIGESRKIGKSLISRETGEPVSVIAVTIDPIQ